MQFEEYLRLKKLVDDHILYFLPEIDPNSYTISEAMAYSLNAGGKKLRPVLLLAACNFCGGDEKLALPYACAIEYIHTYSLIHDDLPAMDNDDLRRGNPTNHKVFGEAVAILAGDGLLTSAFEAMNKDMLLYLDNVEKLKRRVRAIYEISKGAGCRGMIAGQIADIEAQNISIAGEVRGNVKVNELLELSSSARIYGDIHTKELIIDQGARFIGKSTYDGSDGSQNASSAGKSPTVPLSAKNNSARFSVTYCFTNLYARSSDNLVS